MYEIREDKFRKVSQTTHHVILKRLNKIYFLCLCTWRSHSTYTSKERLDSMKYSTFYCYMTSSLENNSAMAKIFKSNALLLALQIIYGQKINKRKKWFKSVFITNY